MDIQPDKQNLDQTFSTTVYYIDFYQRDYKWTEEPVRRLLDDVFYHFDETYQKHAELEPNKENINARYPWYYLNTYVTNTVGGPRIRGRWPTAPDYPDSCFVEAFDKGQGSGV